MYKFTKKLFTYKLYVTIFGIKHQPTLTENCYNQIVLLTNLIAMER